MLVPDASSSSSGGAMRTKRPCPPSRRPCPPLRDDVGDAAGDRNQPPNPEDPVPVEEVGMENVEGAAAAVDVDAGGDGSQSQPIDIEAGGGSQSQSQSQSLNSHGVSGKLSAACWEDFVPILDDAGVRTHAICKRCGKRFSARASIGTGSLNRHMAVCREKQANDNLVQSRLSMNADGLHNWVYDSTRARSELCRLIARLDLPLGVGETQAWEDYIKNAHNPRFSKVSRQSTTRDMHKLFAEQRALIMNSVPVSTVSSESCFSCTARILEDRRRRLLPEHVEMLTCLKDWDQAARKAQHVPEDKALEELFEDMYLDEPDGEGSGSGSTAAAPGNGAG